MKRKIDRASIIWKNKPDNFILGSNFVIFESIPYTNIWSKTYNDQKLNNASSLTVKIKGNFTFSCQVHFKYNMKKDHAGILLFLDEENYLKVYVEYIDEEASYLSTVVTYAGYSDMATYRIGSAIDRIWYRVSHRDGCILVEYSFDESHFKQMRLFHMKSNDDCYELGLFAASPENSSFDAEFRELVVEDCRLKEYRSEKNERTRKTNKIL